MEFLREQKNLKGKTALVRADLDAPHENGKILDDYRIVISAATVAFLRKAGAKIIVISKLGRPNLVSESDWQKNSQENSKETLFPEAVRLGEILNLKVSDGSARLPDYDIGQIAFFRADIREKKNLEMVKNARPSEIIILENIRFYAEEKKCDENFAKALASLADFYVDEAFAMVHRKEATVALLPKFLPSYAGLNLEKEIAAMRRILDIKENPFLVIAGGVKISDKIGAIKNLGKRADKILVGGALANLFFRAKGYETGQSVLEADKLELAQELLRNFKDKIILPDDVVVAETQPGEHAEFKNIRIAQPAGIKPREAVLDIGPKTILNFSSYIKTAKKMVWNGPMGYFENKSFSYGTMSIARIFASKCRARAYGLAGGGDTLSAIHLARVEDQIDFISTGGSAMLDFLAGEDLPGIKALE